jgi:hypothetical protein
MKDVFDQMKKEGKGEEIAKCMKCKKAFWIYWKLGDKPQINCAVCTLSKCHS